MIIRTQGRSLRRIHIIGGPGSGKTYLARQLSQRLGIPAYELDKIAFEGRDFVDRPLDARLSDVSWIASQPSWVTEGIFLGWTDELVKLADVVVWLDCVSWPLAFRRIVRRFAHHGLEEAKRQPGMRKFNRFDDYTRNLRQLMDVFYSSRQYYNARVPSGLLESRVATAQSLQPYRHKVVHCRTTNDVQEFIANIEIEETRVKEVAAV